MHCVEGARRMITGAIFSLLAFLPFVGFAATEDGSPPGIHPSGMRQQITTSEKEQPKMITLDFENVRLDLLVKFFDELTGKYHIVEGGGFDTLDLIYVDHPLSVAEAHQMFLSAVKALGYGVSIEGDTVRVTSRTFHEQPESERTPDRSDSALPPERENTATEPTPVDRQGDDVCSALLHIVERARSHFAGDVDEASCRRVSDSRLCTVRLGMPSLSCRILIPLDASTVSKPLYCRRPVLSVESRTALEKEVDRCLTSNQFSLETHETVSDSIWTDYERTQWKGRNGGSLFLACVGDIDLDSPAWKRYLAAHPTLSATDSSHAECSFNIAH